MASDRFPGDVAPHWSADPVVAPIAGPVGRQAVLADPHGAVFSVSKVIAGKPRPGIFRARDEF